MDAQASLCARTGGPAAASVYPAEQAYPRNQWYIAAFSHEIGRELLAREILDTPVALFRLEDGTPIALHDRCPHRGLPLTMGRLEGDRLRCGYHGIAFAPDGRPVEVPSQKAVPSSLCVPAFPVIEKWQVLWIWMGDAAKADPALLPDHDWLGLTREGYHPTPFFMMEIDGNFQYLHDNLLDSTHVSYLHAGALDDGNEMASAKITIEEDGQFLSISYHTPGSCFTENVAAYFRVEPNKPYDRILLNQTYVPSISIGKQTIRDPQDPSASPVELYAINALTPVSRSRTRVFHMQITSFDPGWRAEDIENVRGIVAQDKVAIEAMQARYEKYGDTHEISLAADNMGIRCRRAMAALIAVEEV